MLAVSIVDKHHRELQGARLVELNQAKDSCRGLLTASDHAGDQILILRMHQVHQVAAIVYDDVRPHFQNPSDVLLILLRRSVIPREHIQSGLHEGCRNVVLSRKRVASRHIHLGSTSSENLAEVCCLGLKMHRKSHLESLERESGLELLFQSVQKRHMMSYPVYFQPAVLPKLRISDFACHVQYYRILINSQNSIFEVHFHF